MAKNSSLFSKLLIVVVAISGLVLGLYAQDIIKTLSNEPPEFKNATLYPRDFRLLPEFSLQDDQQQDFTRDNFMSKWSLLFFGFTHCPDVCPNTMAIIQTAYAQLPEYQKDLQVVFVSVDPERDEPQQLGEYVKYFNPEFIGITGNIEALKTLSKGMSIHFEKEDNPDNPEHYQVNHYAGIFVISPEGRQHALISPPHLPGALASDLKTMIEAY